jgi:hypothetical protein
MKRLTSKLQQIDWYDLISTTIPRLLLLAFVVFVVAVISDLFFWHEVEIAGSVVGRSYTPSSVHTGVGITSGGESGVVTAISSDKYIVAIKTQDGVDGYEVDNDTYYSYEIGDYAVLTCRVGNVLGLRLGCNK